MNILQGPLLHKEKKICINKLKPYIGERLKSLTAKDARWTQKELGEALGVAQNRMSEMVNYENYPDGGLNEAILINLLSGGEEILTVTELIKNVRLTEREKEYLKRFEAFQDPGVRERVLKIIDGGLDLKVELDKIIQENGL